MRPSTKTKTCDREYDNMARHTRTRTRTRKANAVTTIEMTAAKTAKTTKMTTTTKTIKREDQ